MALTIGAGWFACFMCTATGLFSEHKEGFGYASRTDRYAYIIADSPWFRVPYRVRPGRSGTVH